jgi:hypothetical protein
MSRSKDHTIRPKAQTLENFLKVVSCFYDSSENLTTAQLLG